MTKINGKYFQIFFFCFFRKHSSTLNTHIFAKNLLQKRTTKLKNKNHQIDVEKRLKNETLLRLRTLSKSHSCSYSLLHTHSFSRGFMFEYIQIYTILKIRLYVCMYALKMQVCVEV